jgi:hypothetical protein
MTVHILDHLANALGQQDGSITDWIIAWIVGGGMIARGHGDKLYSP